MRIQCVPTGFIQTNTYLFDCGGASAAVDPGAEADRILAAAEAWGKPIRYVLLTHAHWDHVGAVRALQDGGARVFLHESDVKILKSDFTPDVLLRGGESLALGDRTVTVLHTPGHTAGGVCYLCGGAMFSGDTLFRLEVGRCDLPTGNFAQMKESLKKLFALTNDYRVLPGHGEETTLGFERTHNPYRTYTI